MVVLVVDAVRHASFDDEILQLSLPHCPLVLREPVAAQHSMALLRLSLRLLPLALIHQRMEKVLEVHRTVVMLLVVRVKVQERDANPQASLYQTALCLLRPTGIVQVDCCDPDAPLLLEGFVHIRDMSIVVQYLQD